MKKLFIIVALTYSSFAAFAVSKGSAKTLFPIVADGLIGYINSAGEVIIKPKFRNAGNFSEGLAAARLNGSYGYIDQTGNFVIPEAFDYATDFSEGLAIVYRQGKPVFIDKAGKEPFKILYKEVEPFKNGYSVIKTASGKMGLLDKTGKLSVDTIFDYVGAFSDGLAVVRGLHHNPYSQNNKPKAYEIGVIDLTGKFIVPYGKYEKINDFQNGHAIVELPALQDDKEGKTAQTGVIDKRGTLLFSFDQSKQSYLEGAVCDGLIKVNLYKYWIPEDPGVLSTSSKDYEGFMNLKGALILNDTTYKYVNDFSENRAFVTTNNWKNYLINTEGNLVTNKAFERTLDIGFRNGIAFVETEDGWGAIDVNGNFLIKPTFEGIDDAGLIGDYFFFYEEQENEERLYGIADKNGNIILEPQLQEFSREGFNNGLLKAIVNKKLCYLNDKGEVIWQEFPGVAKTQNLNIDFMNRGYFRAYSGKSAKRTDNYGGFATSENYPVKIEKSQKFPKKSLSVVARPEAITPWFNSYNGFKILVVNNTKRDWEFEAQDSRISLKVQALDKDGQWKDIEYLPNSWCGNSYHTLVLDANHYWTFTAPVYEGAVKTKLRAALTYPDPADKPSIARKEERERKEITIYSNEFNGSVNPGQFWRKREYFPNGIMDPYNE